LANQPKFGRTADSWRAVTGSRSGQRADEHGEWNISIARCVESSDCLWKGIAPMKLLNQVPSPCRAVGLAGLIPFWFLAVACWFLSPRDYELAIDAQINYGAIILSFLGAVHWGLAVASRDAATWGRIVWSVSPSLLGWVATLMAPAVALVTLLLGFVLTLVFDDRAFRGKDDQEWYRALRRVLSVGAISAILVVVVQMQLSEIT